MHLFAFAGCSEQYVNTRNGQKSQLIANKTRNEWEGIEIVYN